MFANASGKSLENLYSVIDEIEDKAESWYSPKNLKLNRKTQKLVIKSHTI